MENFTIELEMSDLPQIADSVRFTSDFPMADFMKICGSAHICGSTNHAHYRCEEGNYRAYMFATDNIICDFVIFKVMHGGLAWELQTFSTDKKGRYSKFVTNSMKLAKRQRKLISGDMPEAECRLWLELRNGGMSCILFDTENGAMAYPSEIDLSQMDKKYKWVTSPTDEFNKNSLLCGNVELISAHGTFHNGIGNPQ